MLVCIPCLLVTLTWMYPLLSSSHGKNALLICFLCFSTIFDFHYQISKLNCFVLHQWFIYWQIYIQERWFSCFHSFTLVMLGLFFTLLFGVSHGFVMNAVLWHLTVYFYTHCDFKGQWLIWHTCHIFLFLWHRRLSIFA